MVMRRIERKDTQSSESWLKNFFSNNQGGILSVYTIIAVVCLVLVGFTFFKVNPINDTPLSAEDKKRLSNSRIRNNVSLVINFIIVILFGYGIYLYKSEKSDTDENDKSYYYYNFFIFMAFTLTILILMIFQLNDLSKINSSPLPASDQTKLSDSLNLLKGIIGVSATFFGLTLFYLFYMFYDNYVSNPAPSI